MKDELKFFKENGYVVLKGIFSDCSIKEMQSTLEAILKSECAKLELEYKNFDESLSELKDINTKIVSKIQRCISRTPEFYALSSNQKISKFIRELFSVGEYAPLYHLNNGIIFTFPKSYVEKKSINISLTWHKDTFFTIPKSEFVHIWFPIMHDSSEEIGTLRVCEKSHKDGIGSQQYNIDDTYNYKFTSSPEESKKYKQKSVEVLLGDALLFDGNTLHASGVNSSNKVRCTQISIVHNALGEHFKPVGGMYLYDGHTPEQYYYDTFKDDKILPEITKQLESFGEPEKGF